MEIESLTSLRDLSGMVDSPYQTMPRVDLSKGESDTFESQNKKKPKIDAPIVDFFKKLYGGIANTFKQAHINKNNKKAEGADFTEVAKEWGKTVSKEGKTLLMAELLPQLKTVLGIPSIKKIAEDKGLSAAVLESFKMGIIDAVTLVTYFGILVPFVASGAAAAVNTLLNNVPFLKPYINKIKEQEEAAEKNKNNEVNMEESYPNIENEELNAYFDELGFDDFESFLNSDISKYIEKAEKYQDKK